MELDPNALYRISNRFPSPYAPIVNETASSLEVMEKKVRESIAAGCKKITISSGALGKCWGIEWGEWKTGGAYSDGFPFSL